MDAVWLLPSAPRGTVVDGFVHSIPLTIHRSMCSQPSSYLQLGPLFGLNIEWLSYGATGGVSQSYWMLYTLQGKLCHTWCLEASERHHCHRYIDGERPFQRVRKQPAYGTVAINWHSRAASQGDRTILTLLLPWVRTRSTAANAAGLEPGTQARALTLQAW